MKVSIYLATSINGYITQGQDDSDWVNDWEIFTSKIKEYGCIVMGRKTYECAGDLFPYENALNIVLSSSLLKTVDEQKAIFLNKTPLETIEFAKSKGFDKILLVGGTNTVSRFLQEGLVDDIFLTIHPFLIGEGKKIISDASNYLQNLKLISFESLKSELITLHYQIIKN